jgi:hypothetical protein
MPCVLRIREECLSQPVSPKILTIVLHIPLVFYFMIVHNTISLVSHVFSIEMKDSAARFRSCTLNGALSLVREDLVGTILVDIPRARS